MPAQFIDVSHVIEDGLVTYRGLPAPLVCDFLSREASREHYAPGVEFQIGKIEMVANTGTYVDVPFHRYADGDDLADVPVEKFVGLECLVVDAREAGREVSAPQLRDYDVAGKAVLVRTDWSQHWNTNRYFEDPPYLSEDAAIHLRNAGAALVGIDSLNIDNVGDLRRPVHSTLLAAGIPIVEHMTNLIAVPETGATFHAPPVKVRGMGTFPVRAFCRVDE
ncbi:MAG: cyclase family protein [Pirellulales bacterium]|nr:cyclase family protein [Pirellulales bacterium]